MKTSAIIASLCILALLGCSDDNEPLFPAEQGMQVPAEQLAPLEPVVHLEAGKLSGQTDNDTATWEWLGVPFAQRHLARTVTSPRFMCTASIGVHLTRSA